VNLIARILGSGERRALTETGWLRTWAIGEDTWTGRPVTVEGSLQQIAVFACVRVLAETIGTLPLLLYRTTPDGGRERATEHPLYRLLHERPNPYMTSVELRECMVGHLALWGNAYWSLETDGTDRIVAVWPLRPDRMSLDRHPETGRLVYTYQPPNGQARRLVGGEVAHFRGLSPDGFVGYSPIHLARQSVALSAATEEYGAKFFGNNSTPGGVLTVKGGLSEPGIKRLKETWESAHRGLETSHRVAVLEEGVSWQQIGVPARDAQFLETRKFQTNEIARLFRVPPHLIQDLERATFTNIEHQSIDFVVHTIRPWLVRIEQVLKRDLLDGFELHFAEHLVDGLLRGDQQSRYAAYATGRSNGFLSANDIRRLENMSPLDPAIGDVYLQPLNMVNAELANLGVRSTPHLRSLATPRREQRSATTRRKLADRFRGLLRDSAGRLVGREVADVLAAARRLLADGEVDQFDAWLADYYADLPPVVGRIFMPSMLAYGEALEEDAAAELDAEPNLDAGAAFVRDYVLSGSSVYAERSLAQIRDLVGDALAEGTDPLAAVEERLDEWKQKRADKLSAVELTALAGAVTITAWKALGVLRVRWVAAGSSSCGFCRRLNGQVVGISTPFAQAGQDLAGEGEAHQLIVKRKTTHPPVHSFCVCGLAAEG
jgi:HK97 family phage portal protein